MGDVGTGLMYLCKSCCCIADISADSSQFSSKTKADPRESAIDAEFLARNYKQDASGRFYTQPTPTSAMLSGQSRSKSGSELETGRQRSSSKVNSKGGDSKDGNGLPFTANDSQGRRYEELRREASEGSKVPPLLQANSASTNASSRPLLREKDDVEGLP